MRISLINAPTSAEFSDPAEYRSHQLRSDTREPQLGILSLAAVLESQELHPQVVDLNRLFYQLADNHDEEALDDFASVAACEIASVDAEIYGFGTICSGYPLTIRIARHVKSLRRESTIVFGGPQASVVSKQTLNAFPFVDFILRGEAEQTLPVLLEELMGHQRFNQVPGLTYRTPFGVQANPDAPVIVDLDALPSPAYHLTGELRGLSKASLELGRGCPFSCTFCSTNDFFRRKFRLRSPERVIQDMRSIEAEYGIRAFCLVHDMFTVDHKRVRAFCHAMLDSGLGYSWSCSARTDCVDQELIELMAAAGCTGMFFGVETGSERMQKMIDKHLDVRKAHEIIDIAERAGIDSTISLIMGFPEETMDDLRDTARMFMHSARTPQSSPQLNILSPLANTPLHLQYKDEMTLEALCSDISHQGCRQDPEDVALIRKYPDIFPNFYLLPTPRLDREFLLEFREFTLMAETRFRWLLCAVDQASSGGLVDVFSEWWKARKIQHSELFGRELRMYYRQSRFVAEFISFLKTHPAGNPTAVKNLMEFEEAFNDAPAPAELSEEAWQELASGEILKLSDVPVRRDRGRVVELNCNLEQVIDAVKDQREPVPDSRSCFYAVKQAPGMASPVYQVSPRIALAARACSGAFTIGAVVDQLSETILEIPAEWRSTYSMGLVEKAWNEGIIAIYRTRSLALANQEARRGAWEYSVMSACGVGTKPVFHTGTVGVLLSAAIRSSECARDRLRRKHGREGRLEDTV
jgi:hypothetical protein